MQCESLGMLAGRAISAAAASVVVWLMLRYREHLVQRELRRFQRFEARLPQLLRGRGMSRRQVAAGIAAIICIFAAVALLLWASVADSIWCRLKLDAAPVPPAASDTRPASQVGFWIAASTALILWTRGATRLARRRKPGHPAAQAAPAAPDETGPAGSRVAAGGWRAGRPGRLVRVLDVAADFVLGGVIITIAVIYFWPR